MRQTIKKLMLSALFIVLIGSNASAQGMPVYDNTNFISFVKSLLESGKQTANLMKTVKFVHSHYLCVHDCLFDYLAWA